MAGWWCGLAPKGLKPSSAGFGFRSLLAILSHPRFPPGSLPQDLGLFSPGPLALLPLEGTGSEAGLDVV